MSMVLIGVNIHTYQLMMLIIGRHIDVTAKLQTKMKKSHNQIHHLHIFIFHCITLQQNLCLQIFQLDHMLSLDIKTVNILLTTVSSASCWKIWIINLSMFHST